MTHGMGDNVQEPCVPTYWRIEAQEAHYEKAIGQAIISGSYSIVTMNDLITRIDQLEARVAELEREAENRRGEL